MTSRRRRDEQDEQPEEEAAADAEGLSEEEESPPPPTTFEVRADEFGNVELKSGMKSYGRALAGAVLTFPIEEKPE